MVKVFFVISALTLLVGCMGAKDSVYDRVEWQQSAEYQTCKQNEDSSIQANKAAWKKYNNDLAKAEAEYPQKIEQYEKALLDYQQNGGLMPLIVTMPELSISSPPLLSKGQCFNPPKNFEG